MIHMFLTQMYVHVYIKMYTQSLTTQLFFSQTANPYLKAKFHLNFIIIFIYFFFFFFFFFGGGTVAPAPSLLASY